MLEGKNEQLWIMSAYRTSESTCVSQLPFYIKILHELLPTHTYIHMCFLWNYYIHKYLRNDSICI